MRFAMINIFPFTSIPHNVLSFWDKAILVNPWLTPFHSYGWLSSWCGAYATSDNAIVIVESDAQGSVRALLPMLSRSDELRSLPSNATDYTGLVWVEDDKRPVENLASYLRSEAEHRPVTLWNVRDVDPLVKHLSMMGCFKGIEKTPILVVEVGTACYQPERTSNSISLMELDHKALKLKKLEAEIRFAHTTTHDELIRSIEIHTQRWQLKGEPGKFADPCRIDFVKRVIEQSPVKFFFATMYIEDELIAYRFGPRDLRVYYDWNTGFDPRFKKLSPGVVLLKATFEHLRTTEIQYLDFLRGDEAYKLAWAETISNVYELAVTLIENKDK